VKTKFIGFALGIGLAAFAAAPTASAQFHHGHGGHGGPGGPFAQPAGFGNGQHDLQPHWHTTQTPFGNSAWYGNGLHDLRPHGHTVSPFNGVTSYSNGPFRSTQSYNGFPGGGYGGYPAFGGAYPAFGVNPGNGGFRFGLQFGGW
jgi:hypothetical protein